MRRILLHVFLSGLPLLSAAQDIVFIPDAQWAMDHYSSQSPVTIGYCTDSLRIDTIYVENASNGEMEMIVQRYPYARYEFYSDNALYRRIDISHEATRSDTTRIEHLETGELDIVVQESGGDTPNGAYHEFFPNGNIRIKGTLDGYNADGTLKKTGEWKQWDETGKVIRQETYP